MSEEKKILDKAQEVAKDVAVKAKDVASTAKEKVSTFVAEHEDQIHSGIEKTGEFVDDKTKHRWSDKIDKAQQAAKRGVTKIRSSDSEASEGPERSAGPQESDPDTGTAGTAE
jgi:hypothetical protein